MIGGGLGAFVGFLNPPAFPGILVGLFIGTGGGVLDIWDVAITFYWVAPYI